MPRLNFGRRGVSALAYGLVVGLVSVVALAAIQSGGSGVNALFSTVSGRLLNAAPAPVVPAAPTATPVVGYVAFSAGTGTYMEVVPLKTQRTMASPTDYHAACQEYGLSAYNTSDTNPACQGLLDNYPVRVGDCNMGAFNSSSYDYRFQTNVPNLSVVYWIAVNYSNQLGLEYNGVGPCSTNEQIGACGTGSLSGNGNGIRHSKNPIYGANYDVRNQTLSAGTHILCTRP